jgi:hypothetical protein
MSENSLVNFFLLFCLTAGILATPGCKKKDIETYPETRRVLMTVNFTDNYINPKLGAIVFASDSMGNVIADTLVKGNSQVILLANPGVKIPARFMLTIAAWEPSMHNFEISIKSYMQVTSAQWTFKGHRPDTLGHFTVNLINVPPATLILYANAGYANLTTITSNVNNLSYLDPDNLFIKTENSQGQKYLWINDIHPGETYNADLSLAQTPAFSTISLEGKYYEARVWGYKETDYENSLPVMTSFSLGDVPSGNQVQVSVLPGEFQGYRTELKLVENWESNTEYFCRVNGAIPASFQKTDARILSVNTYTGGKIEVHSVGNFTTANSTWQFYGHNNQSFSWTMCGSDTTTTFQLPHLSPSLLQMFPTLSIDSLNFLHVELASYPGIASYNEFLNHLFDPSSPHSQNNLNASTLIFGQSK